MKTEKRTPKRRRTTPAASVAAPPTTAPTLEGVNQGAIETMALGVDAIRAEIERVRGGKAKSKRDPGSLIASLAAKAGAIYEATRKAEAARLKRLESITPALVLAWFRQLDRADREHLIRELSVIESRKSGLA